MKAYALLGGPIDLWPRDIQLTLQKARQNNDLIVGVDRGALFLEELGIVPDLAIGDFDSLKKADLNQVEKSVPDIRYSNPVKDWTDSELMLRTVFNDYNADSLIIYGATGGRIDHFLINLLMLLNPGVRRFVNRVTIVDQQNWIDFYDAGKHSIAKKTGYPYIGFATLTPTQNFNIVNARYELYNYCGNYPRVFSSNEFLPKTEQIEIILKKGIVAAIYSKDINRFSNFEKNV